MPTVTKPPVLHKITLGRTLTDTVGYRKTIKSDLLDERLADALESLGQKWNWWSPHTWWEHRCQEEWEAAAGVGVDLDYHCIEGKHSAPTEDAAVRLEAAELPGSLFHRTPRGARVVFIFAEPVTDAQVFQDAARGAGRLLEGILAKVGLLGQVGQRAGFAVDQKALTDRARLFWGPCALVPGEPVRRCAEVTCWGAAFDPQYLAGCYTGAQTLQTSSIVSVAGPAAIAEGERNGTLTSMAGSMRRRGMTPDAIEAALLIENRLSCKPPLDAAEVRKIARSVSRYASEPQSRRPWPVMDDAAFYGLANEVVRLVGPNSEADPVGILLQFLVAFGNLIGRFANYRVEGTDHFGNLFLVLVGATSKARKGTAWNQVRSVLPVSEWLDHCVTGGLSSGEGLIWAVRDDIQRTNKKGEVEVEPGVSDKRLLTVEPEFCSVLRVLEREGNTLSAIIRKGWDDGSLRTLTKTSPARATGAHISVIGHTTAYFGPS